MTQTLQKVSINKATTLDIESLGLHYGFFGNLPKISSGLHDNISNEKIIIFDQLYDTSVSFDRLVEYANELLSAKSNAVLALKDPELVISVKDFLAEFGRDLKIGTDLTISTKGDYLLYRGYDKNKSDKNKIIELLREKRNVIINLEDGYPSYYTGMLSEIAKETGDCDNLIISSWCPKLAIRSLQSKSTM